MTKEDLKQREKDINKIVNLLSTFGDHHMSEEELLKVSDAYETYYHFLFQGLDTKFILNNMFLLLSSADLMTIPSSEGMFRDFIFIIATLSIDKYLLSHFIDKRMEFKEEREWIKKFKASKNRDDDASTSLKEKLINYQNELKMIEQSLHTEEKQLKMKQ